MIYYGHTANKPDGKPDPDQAHWQSLKDHLNGVTVLARQFASPLNLEAEAELSGLLHDLGKYAERFQGRLRNPATIHGVNHWAAGAGWAIEQKLLPIAFVVDGHHTGIPALGGDAKSLKETRIKLLDPRLRERLTNCSESSSDLLNRFTTDGLVLPPAGAVRAMTTDLFAESLRTRFLFSCLVDADFCDTEEHFTPGSQQGRRVPELSAERALDRLMAHLREKSGSGVVNVLRRQLLADCLAAAEKSPGLFTLTAPTGSGKTLASLAFAMKHIAVHNAALAPEDPRRIRRIITVIPYTSIIEQTARVYRDVFEGMFGPDYVLEHHQAVAPRERPEDDGRDAENERLRRARIASENWASPLVVTTSVQFFESLFARRPSACRKLHNIGRSVVLFDEVQTLPPRLAPSLLSAVRLLTQEPYGVTAVFMTATQPAFNAVRAAALPYGWEPGEISSNPGAMAETLRRTRIELPSRDEHVSWPDLAAILASHSQVLCVVNTTKDARELFRLLPAKDRFHLSSRLCPAHRLEKLKAIRERLAAGQPVRLVSTQLIEAGVDVDFPIAFRALGPLDSIIQTAGRCNREGLRGESCPVIVFRPLDGGTPRGAYQVAAAKTEEFLARHPDAREQLHRPEFYAAYFAELYSLLGPQAAKEDPVFAASEKFDFPKAEEACQLVGENTRSVVVKWGEGTALAAKLEHERHLTGDECRRAQRFSISLYEGEFKNALGLGYVFQPAKDWDFFVWNSLYDANLGACHAEGKDFVC